MHHFRGTLFQGDKLCLDPANVYIDYNSTEVDVTSEWSGHLVVGSEKDVCKSVGVAKLSPACESPLVIGMSATRVVNLQKEYYSVDRFCTSLGRRSSTAV